MCVVHRPKYQRWTPEIRAMALEVSARFGASRRREAVSKLRGDFPHIFAKLSESTLRNWENQYVSIATGSVNKAVSKVKTAAKEDSKKPGIMLTDAYLALTIAEVLCFAGSSEKCKGTLDTDKDLQGRK